MASNRSEPYAFLFHGWEVREGDVKEYKEYLEGVQPQTTVIPIPVNSPGKALQVVEEVPKPPSYFNASAYLFVSPGDGRLNLDDEYSEGYYGDALADLQAKFPGRTMVVIADVSDQRDKMTYRQNFGDDEHLMFYDERHSERHKARKMLKGC